MQDFQDDDFIKSSLCNRCSHCVTVAYKEGIIAVRDTKDSAKQTLIFTAEEWQIFVAGVKQGDFDF